MIFSEGANHYPPSPPHIYINGYVCNSYRMFVAVKMYAFVFVLIEHVSVTFCFLESALYGYPTLQVKTVIVAMVTKLEPKLPACRLKLKRRIERVSLI